MRLNSVWCSALLTLLCAGSSPVFANICQSQPSPTGVLDAAKVKFHFGNGWDHFIVNGNSEVFMAITDALADGFRSWNKQTCRGQNRFAWAYEGWHTLGFDENNSIYGISLVYIDNENPQACAGYNEVFHKIYFWKTSNNVMCEVERVAWDFANQRDPFATGSYDSLRNLGAHEAGHIHGFGESAGSVPISCAMRGHHVAQDAQGNFFYVKPGGSPPEQDECDWIAEQSNSANELESDCLVEPGCLIDPPGVNPGGSAERQEGKRPFLNIPDINHIDVAPVPTVTIGGIVYKCIVIVGPGGIVICVPI